ncbi:MAG: tRNA (cytidine(34)-2'-O)-methyltransferase [Proteobacteria bacterium]|nr:tRNA (cytidine(34)-2'-O)-methyltransferase [Pseudomonadota bacterium]
MRLALYQPEIPQNVGTLIRLGACLGVPIDVIEPTGFLWSDKHLKRSGLDYMCMANVERVLSWEIYQQRQQRIILIDTKAEINFWDFEFKADDVLMLGKESSGVPDNVFGSIQNRVKIPMLPDRRSLNMAIAGAMVLTEALRQTRHEHSSYLCETLT